MLFFLFVRSLLLVFGLYAGTYALWKIAEREHIEDLEGLLDTFAICAVIAYFAGKLPAYVFGGLTGSFSGILRLFTGELLFGFALLIFFILFFVFSASRRKDIWGTLDHSMNPLAITLAIFAFSDALGMVGAGIAGKPAAWLIFGLFVVCAALYAGLARLLLMVERNYRTYFWYRYRRNSAQTGFVAATFALAFGVISSLPIFGRLPIALVSYESFSLVLSLFWILFGFITYYVRSGRWR